MFNSAIVILNKYIDNVTPYNLHSIEMERGENGDDLYYLCCVGKDFYIVFETDYIDPRPYQAEEAAVIFGLDSLALAGWIVMKDMVGGKEKLMSLEVSLDEKRYYESLVSTTEGSYLKHAVLKTERVSAKHSNPNAYGYQ